MFMRHLLCSILLLALGTHIQAAPKSGETTTAAKGAKTKAKAKSLPFYGEVVAVSSRTLTLKGGEGKEDRKITLSAETKIHNDGKPATTEDIVVGKKVGGSAEKSAEGTLKALTVNVGAAQGTSKPKAKAKATETDSKAKKAKE
jgi:hypothetical protein